MYVCISLYLCYIIILFSVICMCFALIKNVTMDCCVLTLWDRPQLQWLLLDLSKLYISMLN